MAWTDVSFTQPPTLHAVRDGLQGGLDAAGTQLVEGKTRLDAVSGAATIAVNPATTSLDGITALRSAVDGLRLSGGRFLCVHPFVHPLGERSGDYAYMTPQQAVEAMADKLADPLDLPGDGELQGVFLILRGADFTGFATALAAFNAVFPVTALQMVQRRAAALATLDTDKLVLMSGARRPRWRAHIPAQHEATDGLGATVGPLLALCEGYTVESTRPEEELDALISARIAHAQELEDAWGTLAGALQGGSGIGQAITGDHGAIRRQLLADAPPFEGYKLAALCGWVGTVEQTTIIQETLGL